MDTLLWIDVETTGLDPDSDALLEIGMLYTDGGLHPIDAPLDLVLRWDGTPDDFIKGMHGSNGLLDACRHGLEPKEAYRLAGSTRIAGRRWSPAPPCASTAACSTRTTRASSPGSGIGAST